MRRYEDFWRVTEDGLVYGASSLGLELTPARRQRLMDSYLSLAAFPDVRPGLEALEVKTFKPDPPVYALGPARLGVPTAQMGFVSSNSCDINGATSAGLRRFWIQRSGAAPPEVLGYNTDRVVSAITDLPGLLRA